MRKLLLMLLFGLVCVYGTEKRNIYMEAAKVVGKDFYTSGEVKSIIKQSVIFNIRDEKYFFKNGNISEFKRVYKHLDTEYLVAQIFYDEKQNIICKKENEVLDLELAATTKVIGEKDFNDDVEMNLHMKQKSFERLMESSFKEREGIKHTKLACIIKNSSFLPKDGFVFIIEYDYNFFTSGVKAMLDNPKEEIKLNEAKADNLVNKYFKRI